MSASSPATTPGTASGARGPSGLHAYPLTPLRADAEGRLDLDALSLLVARAAAHADAVTVLGSTGCAVYLDRAERAAVVREAVAAATGTPVGVGVSALGLREVLYHVEDAAAAGAAHVLLAPVAYQRLTEAEVAALVRDVAERSPLPVVVYDNPATTGFPFTDALLADLAGLPQVAGVKVAPLPDDGPAASRRVVALRAALPAGTDLGLSGDATSGLGPAAGADTWHSVLGGTLPRQARALFDAAVSGAPEATVRSAWQRLAPFWELFAAHGSLRVMAAAAAELGLAGEGCLPRPLLPLVGEDRAAVAATVRGLDAHD